MGAQAPNSVTLGHPRRDASGHPAMAVCARQRDMGAVTGPDGPPQGECPGRGPGAKMGRQEEPDRKMRRSQKWEESKSHSGAGSWPRAPSTPIPPPVPPVQKGPPATEARDQESPRLSSHQPLTKTGQAKCGHVFRVAPRSVARFGHPGRPHLDSAVTSCRLRPPSATHPPPPVFLPHWPVVPGWGLMGVSERPYSTSSLFLYFRLFHFSCSL